MGFMELAVLSNPKRKKRHAKKNKAVVHMKKRKAKKHVKRHVKKAKRVTVVINPKKTHKRRKRHNPSTKGVKIMARKHKSSHRRKSHRFNPASSAMSMIKKFKITDVLINTAEVAIGYIGQGIVEVNLLPMIPGYATMTGIPKTLVKAGSAVGIPMLLAFVLPMVGMPRAQAKETAKMIGLGMLAKVAVSEIAASGLLPAGIGAVVNALPAPRSYGLASAQQVKVPQTLVKNYM